MEIKSHYNEVLVVVHKMFKHIFEGLETRYAKELSQVATIGDLEMLIICCTYYFYSVQLIVSELHY